MHLREEPDHASFPTDKGELAGRTGVRPGAEHRKHDAVGVDAHLRAVAHPRALLAAFRGYAKIVGRHDDPDNAGVGGGDGSTHLSLPADVLIVPDGTVVAVHYGRHADDQWTVDDLLDLNRSVAGKGSP